MRNAVFCAAVAGLLAGVGGVSDPRMHAGPSAASSRGRIEQNVPPQGGGRSASDIGRQPIVLAIEDSGQPTASEWRLLVDIARGTGRAGVRPTDLQRMAIRAMGRMERADAVPILLRFLEEPGLEGEASAALLLVLRANLPQDSADPQLAAALDVVRERTLSPVILGHLPYTSADQVQAAEIRLRGWLELSNPPRPADARGLEALARRNRKLWQLTDETRVALRKLAARDDARLRANDDATPYNAMAALMSAGAVDGELIAEVLGDRSAELRRLAALALFSGGAAIEPAKRTALIREALGDSSSMVRYEALRAWARRETVANGCQPLLAALRDESMHVVLAAIDALADRCRAADDITDVLASEARTPPTIGEWQREAHALVALAKRAAERAALAMPTFRQHLVWQVRMYAARAAAVLKDEATLERLAYDTDDNVREAALPPLRALRHAESDPAFVAALAREDYQLLRTAAIELKDAQPGKDLLAALIDALQRVTAELKDTSRDTRLALIERIRAMAGRDQYSVFEHLLRDYDPRIAAAAADACSALSGKTIAADPQARPRPFAPSVTELTEPFAARVQVDSGRSFEIVFDRLQAPLAYSRFARLVRRHYYDGLTFHRVAPNFVVQGGSPGANEYAGETRFWRDELGLPNVRGTVGISTRGRHTGDGQFFINLVDNASLDFEYTVFGRVRAREMPVVDAIVEGTKILRIDLVREGPERRVESYF